MTREGFSEMLVTIRETAGISKNEMCRRTVMAFSEIDRIERSVNNYGIPKVIHYLNAMNLVLVLNLNDTKSAIFSSEDFAKWLLKLKEQSGVSLQNIASNTGCTHTTIRNIINNKSNVKIDLLLKLVDYFGYTIEFKPIQQ